MRVRLVMLVMLITIKPKYEYSMKGDTASSHDSVFKDNKVLNAQSLSPHYTYMQSTSTSKS